MRRIRAGRLALVGLVALVALASLGGVSGADDDAEGPVGPQPGPGGPVTGAQSAPETDQTRPEGLILGSTRYLFISGAVNISPTTSAFVIAENPTESVITVTIHAYTADGTDQLGASGTTVAVQPGIASPLVSFTQTPSPPGRNEVNFVVDSPSLEIRPTAFYTIRNPDQKAALERHTIHTNEFKTVRRFCFIFIGCSYFSTDAAIFNASDKANTINTTVNAINTAVGTINTTLNTVNGKIDTLQSTANTISGKVGNNTNAFCPEGSVRNDDQGVLQMYVTLFSKTGQDVTINYITNKGLFSKVQTLQANVRFTDDVNNTLRLAGGAFAGNDVDVSIEIISTAPVFLACPVYFNRSIGLAGSVHGGTVQDGNHN